MVTKLTLPSKENAVQEKVNEIIDNLGGGYSAGTGIDISNNTISVDNTVAMKTDIPAPVTETTVSGWGFTKNTGTVTSVNSVSPVNGNVTLSIPTVTDTYSATSSDGMSGKAVASALGSYVPTSRKVNNKALSSDITLTASDVGALPSSTVIPTVNNATLTIQKNSTNVATFTANASSNVTANISVPTKVSDLSNDSGFITGITSGDVTTALGYTPVNPTSLATVATSGSYNDLLNKPTIPTVNNATLTITQGGTTKGTFTANASSNVTIDLDSGGSSRNVGEIVSSTIPLTDAGLHLLDGGVIQRGSYADFVDYIAGLVSTYPDLFTTEANWQSSVSTYGVCGKFVYNSTNNTVRLPKRTSEHGDLIKSYQSGANWYRIYSDGWCEQGGRIIPHSADQWRTCTLLKAFANTDYIVITSARQLNQNAGANYGQLYTGTYTTTGFNYKGWYNDNNNTAIEWQACGYIDISDYQYSPIYEYIVLATSTKTQIEVDIDEVMTDLNGKADVDLSNVNASGTSLASGWSMPSSRYDDLTLGASGATYTAPASGWFVFSKTATAGDQYVHIENNTSKIQYAINAHANYNAPKCFIPCKKGDSITVNYNLAGSTDYFRFIYAEGESNV